MINLLQETLDMIEYSDHATRDVAFVCCGGECCTWKSFSMLIDFEYDDGPGEVKINHKLKILFKDDSWLERYFDPDGSEGWDFKKRPVRDGLIKGKTITIFEDPTS